MRYIIHRARAQGSWVQARGFHCLSGTGCPHSSPVFLSVFTVVISLSRGDRADFEVGAAIDRLMRYQLYGIWKLCVAIFST
jgi:hypothetical protein